MISATELELQTLGRDDVLRFNTGDWVEIIDDVREFSQRTGEMRQITVNEAARRITFTAALPAEMIPAVSRLGLPARPQSARAPLGPEARSAAHRSGGTTPVFQDLDAGTTGVINVPAAGTTLLLENGVTVSFASTGDGGLPCRRLLGVRRAHRRRVGGDARQRAAARHPSPLRAAGHLGRGRRHRHGLPPPWPPAARDMTAAAPRASRPSRTPAGSSRFRTRSIRSATRGGTVCLGVGQFQLREPVQLDRRAIGAHQGAGRGDGARHARRRIHHHQRHRAGDRGPGASCRSAASSAINVRTALGLSLQRLLIFVTRRPRLHAPAIALTGLVVGATIRDNAIFAPVGVAGPACGRRRSTGRSC